MDNLQLTYAEHRSEVEIKLKNIFGDRLQYTDFQLNLAKDLEQITQKEKHEVKLNQYIFLEDTLKPFHMRPYAIRELFGYKFFDSDIDTIILKQIHELYQFKTEDVKQMFNILGRVDPKIRTLVFYGKSNTGKSILANAIYQFVSPGYIQRDGGTNVHWLEHLHYKSFVLWEEPSVHMSNVEDCKLIFGGENIIINRKNKNLIERPAGPACIVTCNKPFWHYDNALSNRMIIYNFDKEVKEVFKDVFVAPRLVLRYLLELYDGRQY